MEIFSYPLLLTALAGLSTVLGGCFVFLFKRINARLLSFGLGLSAGVMIYLAFFELLREAGKELASALGHKAAWQAALFFIMGLAIAAIVDLVTVHQAKLCNNLNAGNGQSRPRKGGHCLIYRRDKQQKLLKTGMFVAFAIALHNVPEGIITFTAANLNFMFGITIALAVAIHNIPEGFCVALPIYAATGSKAKSLLYTVLAGLAEPLGALIVYYFLSAYLNSLALGVMLGAVAGIMVYISFDELLPTANRFSRWPVGASGLAAGMVIMAGSLYLLN